MKRERKPVRIALIVREAVKLLKATLPPTIRVEQAIDDAELCVEGDPTQLHQVVMNLCTNSFHAMLESGGRLQVALRRSPPPPPLLANAEVTACALLVVEDGGVGIEPAILDRVFEPFFTTKPPGQGNGMGLAVVHGIVKTHGGHIAIDSVPGRGTRVCVYLPLARPRDDDEASSEGPVLLGQERLLLVDDDDALGAALERSLSALGYAVTRFDSAVAAWAELERRPEAFDLVLSDVSMPELGGLALIDRIRTLRPGLPLLLMTGFAEQLDEATAAQHGAALILKPFSRRELSVALRRLLDPTRAEPGRSS